MPGMGSGNWLLEHSDSDRARPYLPVDVDGVTSPGVNYSDIATSLHKNGPDVLQRMEKSECHKAFSNNYVPDYSSVILMTNLTTSEDHILNYSIHQSAVQDGSASWFADTIDVSHWYVDYH